MDKSEERDLLIEGIKQLRQEAKTKELMCEVLEYLERIETLQDCLTSVCDEILSRRLEDTANIEGGW